MKIALKEMGHFRPEHGERKIAAAVLISADAEWAVVKSLFLRKAYELSPFGEFFMVDAVLPDGATYRILVFNGGWGKVNAAASTQYVIDRWDPPLLINLGTCGGFKGSVQRFSIVLATRSIIYDIVERMGDPADAIANYATDIDLSWLAGEDRPDIKRGVLVSADQDLDPAAINTLRSKYGAIAADWESGAIAYTAERNRKRILIIRAVTDLVGPQGGEVYGKMEIFHRNTGRMMRRLFSYLPSWLERIR